MFKSIKQSNRFQKSQKTFVRHGNHSNHIQYYIIKTNVNNRLSIFIQIFWQNFSHKHPYYNTITFTWDSFWLKILKKNWVLINQLLIFKVCLKVFTSFIDSFKSILFIKPSARFLYQRSVKIIKLWNQNFITFVFLKANLKRFLLKDPVRI